MNEGVCDIYDHNSQAYMRNSNVWLWRHRPHDTWHHFRMDLIDNIRCDKFPLDSLIFAATK